MLQHLSQYLISKKGTQPFTLQSVITKVDLVPSNQLAATIARMKKDIFAAAPLCLPPLLTSCEMDPPFGIDKLRKNIAEACGLA
jgi:GTP-binding protein